MLPATALSSTSLLPALITPVPSMLPVVVAMSIKPSVVTTLAELIVSPFASRIVRPSPAPVMFAVSSATLVTREVSFWAVTLRTTPRTNCDPLERFTPPAVVLIVTLPVPALMDPVPARFPVSEMSTPPLFVLMPATATSRSSASVMLSDDRFVESAAVTALTAVFNVDAVAAVTASTFPRIWPDPLMAPLAAVSVTLAVPASMSLERVRLPVVEIAIEPFSVVMSPPLIARSPVCDTTMPLPSPVRLAITALTAVLTFTAFFAESIVSTLPRTCEAEELSVTPPPETLSVTLLAPALMLPAPVRLPLAILIVRSPEVTTAVAFVVPMARLFASSTVSLPAVILATRLDTAVLTAESFFALMVRTPPAT